jgi:hypothetical protein
MTRKLGNPPRTAQCSWGGEAEVRSSVCMAVHVRMPRCSSPVPHGRFGAVEEFRERVSTNHDERLLPIEAKSEPNDAGRSKLPLCPSLRLSFWAVGANGRERNRGKEPPIRRPFRALLAASLSQNEHVGGCLLRSPPACQPHARKPDHNCCELCWGSYGISNQRASHETTQGCWASGSSTIIRRYMLVEASYCARTK